MAYWWVNHKQTYQQETEGGYIWSPKVKKNGHRNQFYENMILVQPGDIIFSYASAQIRDVGIATGSAVTAQKPSEFGVAGKSWEQEGWFVPVDFQPTDRPLRPKAHIETIRSLLPEKYSPINASGDGNQVAYLAQISAELGELLLNLVASSSTKDRLATLAATHGHIVVDDDIEAGIRDSTDLSATEKEQLVLSRRGQGRFRRELETVEPRCRVTGLAEKRHLKASHIKPWRDSSNPERLDGHNGLLLTPHIDHLFDRGYLSFTDDGELLVSDALSHDAIQVFGISESQPTGGLTAKQRAYMAYHREKIFLGG
ncbi:HNH endonuclease [Halomonas sp. G15]|uniref:HNH endonuclease n=1 Tax=Halomonas sp. G15 TaxID=2903521 RepID=UPI001E45BD60|nr:HNH endonuclease [Halomonas sp. G15]MCE0732458.1 HNH endonuclease [Halomonas sp. G15]